MMIIVSLMLLNEGMLQEAKIITLPIYNTEFRIYNIYIYIYIYIYKWFTFLGKEPPQLRISLWACIGTLRYGRRSRFDTNRPSLLLSFRNSMVKID